VKKIFLLGLVFLICFTIDANAFHWRHHHHHRPVLQAVPIAPINGSSGITVPLVPGVTAAPGDPARLIEVSREVVENLNASDKNLSEASASLKPLLEKYKIETPSTSRPGTSGPVGDPVLNLTPEQRQALIDRILGKRK
jgi:hypothetical protein